MHFSRKRLTVGVLIAAAATLGTSVASASASGNSHTRPVGAVYTLSNAPTGNTVIAFDRYADGTLTQRGEYPTGGLGTGAGLGSQGALLVSGNELFAVNAGSNSISAFRIRSGRLDLEATAPSGGVTPISVTAHDDTLFVLNAGGTGNISGFDTSGHRLTPIPDSTRPLGAGSAGPAQVLFTRDGSEIVVTEKASSTIDTYHVGRGTVGDPVVHASAGATPFGFDIDRNGHVLVSNASGSASSYTLDRHDDLSVISGAVGTAGQAAPCWLIASVDGHYAYTANGGSGTISGFAVGRDGSLSLLDPSGISANLGAGSHPLDESVSPDGGFLFNLTDGLHTITGFSIGQDGALDPVSAFPGLPVGAAGIVAT